MSQLPIDYLLSRRSAKFVQAPGPDDAQLQQILQTAMSAPDHGGLKPWRFSVIRGEALGRLIDLVVDTMREAGSPMPEEKEVVARRWLANVPVLIAIACKLDHSNTKIPEHERMLATGAAVTNMLNAAYMLGFHGFWSTGLGTYVEQVSEVLGYDNLDYVFLGYLALGTPSAMVASQNRPDVGPYVQEWTGL
jgi:nitroreductase